MGIGTCFFRKQETASIIETMARHLGAHRTSHVIIRWRTLPPQTTQSNGMADCENQQLMRIARCKLLKEGLGEDYWFSGDGILVDKANASGLQETCSTMIISACGKRDASSTKTKTT